jgi:hypothetical protein
MIRGNERTLLLFACILASGLVSGCGGEGELPPLPTTGPRNVAGVLSVDVRGKVNTRIDHASAGVIAVALMFEDVNALGLFDAAQTLTAAGKVEPLPESGGELYSATFSLAPQPGGRCGAEPVSLALSLYRAPPNMRFAGALTGYCGDRFHGVPAAALRLTGVLEEVP